MSTPVSKITKMALSATAEGRVTRSFTGWRVNGDLQGRDMREALTMLLDNGYIQVMGHKVPLAVTVPKGRDALHAWMSEDAANRSWARGAQARRKGRG